MASDWWWPVLLLQVLSFSACSTSAFSSPQKIHSNRAADSGLKFLGHDIRPRTRPLDKRDADHLLYHFGSERKILRKRDLLPEMMMLSSTSSTEQSPAQQQNPASPDASTNNKPKEPLSYQTNGKMQEETKLKEPKEKEDPRKDTKESKEKPSNSKTKKISSPATAMAGNAEVNMSDPPPTVQPVIPDASRNSTMTSTSSTTPSTESSPAPESSSNPENMADISISKYPELNNKTLQQNNITKMQVDNHLYYNSTFIVNETIGQQYWVDLNNHPGLEINELLSQSHRRAATIKLKFDFPFYGHKVRNITIATGGFLYTGDYVHSWLAATQYIAPLMANFDTKLSNASVVKYADNGTAFTAEWEKVSLQDKPEDGAFTFQVTLLNTGDIIFVYSVIPVMVENIEDTAHPVKVGLSDAFIMDRTVFFIRKKTIYEYHRVAFNRQDIRNWTVIYLKALPTCLDMQNCGDCLSKVPDFECKWCPGFNKCSTGTFRYRQEWLMRGCDVKNIKERGSCPAKDTSSSSSSSRSSHDHHDESSANVEPSQRLETPSTSSLGGPHARDNVNMSVSGVVGVLLIISLLVGLSGWVVYAYRNPHSTSGQMLIRYRPSQWSWRRGEARYTAATIHM